MWSAHVAHGMHTAMGPAETRSETAPRTSMHPGGVASANIRDTLASGRRGALAASCRRALAMNRIEVLCMRGCLA